MPPLPGRPGAISTVTNAFQSPSFTGNTAASCSSDSQCNDNNACTTDTCDTITFNCVHTPINPNDNNPCTVDSCDQVNGPQHQHIACGAAQTGPNFVVNVTDDHDDGSCDDDCTLREAINHAASGASITFNIPTSDAGYNSATGISTIALATNGDNTFGPSALLVNKTLTIDGGSSKITLSRDTTAQPTRLRLFYVAPSGNLTLQNLTLSGGRAKGGDANGHYSGGGGGAGLGGAIVNAGTLQLIQSTLNNNQAFGGNGTPFGGFVGGGGGLGRRC